MKWQEQGCNLSTLLYRQRMWFLLRTNWVAQFPHIVTLTQQQLVKVEVEVCQTLRTCLRVQGFPAYDFHRTLPINAFIIDSVLFCHKTYSSLARNLTLGRANGRMMTIAFYFFCSLNPLSPNSDQHQFSPNNIHTMSRDEVMRINKMIT